MLARQISLSRITRPQFRRVLQSHPRIERRSDVWGGKAVVANTRIPVFLLVSRMNSGWTESQVIDEYPSLTADDVRAVVEYARVFPARVNADLRAYEQSLPSHLG